MSAASRSSYLRLTVFLMGGALIGKVLGFLREIEMARLLGATFVADSFRGAMSSILLPIAPMQGDIIPSVLIPLHRRWKAAGISAQMFAPLVATFGMIAVLLAAIVWIFADAWVGFLVGGFGQEAHDLTVAFVRVMALAMPASVMTACMMCVEISVGRSRITSLRAAIQNLSIMIGILVMVKTGNPLAIAWSFSLSFNGMAIVGWWLLWREGEITPRGLRLRNARAAFRIFFRRTRPLFIQPVADQANIVVERLMGSGLAVGTIASLDYARTLTETAQFLISQPIGYAVLAQEAGSAGRIRGRVEAIARPLLALSLPTVAFIVVFAPDIVSIVFQRGVFQAEAVALTSGSLRGITCGLWAATLGWILLRMLNAAGRNGAVAKVFISAYAASIISNVCLAPWLGSLGLGLSEGARGVTLLIGASLTLGCGGLILGIVLANLPQMLLVIVTSLLVQQSIDTHFLRLALGGIPLAAVTLYGVRPQLAMTAARLRARFGKRRLGLEPRS